MPSHDRLASKLIEKVYENTIERVLGNIKTEEGGTLGIDGATDNIAMAKSNVIDETSHPRFVKSRVTSN